MTGEIRNPVKLPTDLNPAEKEFARCLAKGIPCIIGDGKLPKKEIESGEGANMVRGEVIRFFAYGGNEKNPILGSEICLLGAWISGSLELIHARIPYALVLSHCYFHAYVILQSAECGGLYLNGSYLAQGLFADGLTTRGSVNLRDGFFARREVRLMGANIGLNLDCTGGNFHSSNLDECALSADSLITKGSVNLRDGFSAEGEVRLLGASIGRKLDCSGGKFHNPGKYALSADDLTTKGDVNLRDGFSAEGEVRFSSASIGKNLDCAGGKFHNPNKCALSVEAGNISGSLLWWHITCEGIANFAYARADVLVDAPDSWKSCKVALNGFAYTRFVNPMDASFRINWLANRPDGVDFSPLPYEQAAKVLFGMGHSTEAWDILHEKRRLEREHKQAPWWQRAWGQWIDALTDFVYRPWRTVGWTAGVVLAGAMLFWAANHCKQIVPHQPIVLAKEEYQKAREAGCHPFDAARAAVPDYPGFNPLIFSLDVFVPLFNLHQESYWAPNSGKGDFFRWLTRGKGEFEGWWLLTAWYWIEIMAGWLLSSLLLLSVTGLLRPRIGGGD